MDNLDKLFCVQCGSQSLILKKPDGDTHVRTVCQNCNHIIYQNPKIVTGSVCSYKDKILLCKRAIDPQKGLWTLPAGYLEINESIEEGAVREAYEEAFAKIQIVRLLATYSLKHISQIQVIYEAKLLNGLLDHSKKKFGDVNIEYLSCAEVEITPNLDVPMVLGQRPVYKRED